MLRDAWPLVSAAEMRALDLHTIEGLGVPGELLMESAGRTIADTAQEACRPGGRIIVVCGAGNNGGDGLVAARHLHLQGLPTSVVSVGDPARLSGDAALNWARARAAGVPVIGAGWHAEPGDVLVDALFGTGLTRAVEGAAAAAIAELNARPAGCALVAADLPSGLDADTGQVLGSAARADVTVCIGLPKLGLALEPGRSRAGRIVVARIGIVDEAPGLRVRASLLTAAAIAALLPERPSHGHKGSFGHVLVVAGSEGKTGAAALAAAGAGRIGAGLVTIACPRSANGVLEVKCTEAMTAPLDETEEHSLAASAEGPLVELAGARDAVILGPGMGRAAETTGVARRLIASIDRPLVVDADALVACAGEPGALRRKQAPTVLTPHPGEAAVLLGGTASEINRDRVSAARQLAAESGAVACLKGASTVTASPDGRVRVNPTGGPLLATGGTGDVLAGVIGGLLAQGLDAFDAASVGAFVHGCAADRLTGHLGRSGALAGDVALEIPTAVAALLADAREGKVWTASALAFPEPH